MKVKSKFPAESVVVCANTSPRYSSRMTTLIAAPGVVLEVALPKARKSVRQVWAVGACTRVKLAVPETMLLTVMIIGELGCSAMICEPPLTK